MRYLRRFNESLDIKEVIYDIEDVLLDLDDLNLYKKREIQYNVYSDEKKLNVEFWKDSISGGRPELKNGEKSWIGVTDFNQLLPIIKKLIRVMNTHSDDVNLIMTYYVVNSKRSDFVEKIVKDKYRDGITFNDTWFDNNLHRKKLVLFSIEFKI
jgi:hypothetical protein